MTEADLVNLWGLPGDTSSWSSSGVERAGGGHSTPLRSSRSRRSGSGAAGLRPGRTASRSRAGDSPSPDKPCRGSGTSNGARGSPVSRSRSRGLYLNGKRPDDNLLATSHPPTLGRSHRRIYNLLIANAWDRIGDDVTHCVAKVDLHGSHEGGERLADSIDRLMRTIVRVRVEQDGRPAMMKVALLSRTTEHDDAKGLLYYRLDAELWRIIQDSRVFGRLRKEVMFAFISKYAFAPYEMDERL